ncbi:hypothetical protein BJV82DRAFT_592143 [Fennellomyces sp. T-0311]|nr:hypothetical protein BJV82DRAFT_592143 [Fennellomyces sp. T-0311]
MPADEEPPQQAPPVPPPQTHNASASSSSGDPTQQPRKKRAKIVSACGECRRKKTKCNGEQPCRSCEKSGVPCIYPSATQTQGDDKRTTLSKAALEAIEERLKTIEDMLRVILQSAQPNADLDPAIVNQFLNNTRPSSSSSSSSTSSPPSAATAAQHHSSPPHYPPHYPQQQQQQQQQHSQQHPQHRLSEYDIRLPSIHNLSAPSAYHPHDAEMPPPPPSHMSMQDYYRPTSTSSAPRPPSDQPEDYGGAFHPVKKRKR